MARVVRADVEPDARGIHHQLGAVLDEKGLVAGGLDVVLHRMRDVGVQVVLRGAGGEVGRAFLAGDRAPREQRTAPVCELPRALARRGQRTSAVLEQRTRDLRPCRHDHQ